MTRRNAYNKSVASKDLFSKRNPHTDTAENRMYRRRQRDGGCTKALIENNTGQLDLLNLCHPFHYHPFLKFKHLNDILGCVYGTLGFHELISKVTHYTTQCYPTQNRFVKVPEKSTKPNMQVYIKFWDRRHRNVTFTFHDIANPFLAAVILLSQK